MDYENPYVAPLTNSAIEVEDGGAQRTDLAWLLFSFEGRIPRRSYWGATISTSLVAWLLFGVVILLTKSEVAYVVLLMALFVPVFWISLAIAVKQWHDRDKSGTWVLINLIPYIGSIWTLVECGCLRGTVGPNDYGPDPT